MRLYPTVCAAAGFARVRVLSHFLVPHVGCVQRARVLLQAGRCASAVEDGACV